MEHHHYRFRYVARHNRCAQSSGSVPILLASLLAGHAKFRCHLIPATSTIACLWHKPGDLLRRDCSVVPARPTAARPAHVLTNSVRVLPSKLSLDIGQFLPHVVTLNHLSMPPRLAGPVATMPAQPVKVGVPLKVSTHGVEPGDRFVMRSLPRRLPVLGPYPYLNGVLGESPPPPPGPARSSASAIAA